MACPFSVGIWNAVFDWLDISMVIPTDIVQLYEQMGFFIRATKIKRWKFLFWHVTCWCLWNVKNEIIIKGGIADAGNTFSKKKMLSWQ